MDGNSCCFVSLCLLFLIVPQWSSALDLKGSNEGSCFDVNSTSMDFDWATNVKEWHLPLISRSDLYHFAAGLLDKPAEEISENYLYYKGCVTWGGNAGEKSAWMMGFEGKKAMFTIDFSQNLDRVSFTLKETQEHLATCYTTLTDNKTFYVNACCHKGEDMVWAVNSVMKYLPEETLSMIKDHAEALGFDRKQFTGLNYDHC